MSEEKLPAPSNDLSKATTFIVGMIASGALILAVIAAYSLGEIAGKQQNTAQAQPSTSTSIQPPENAYTPPSEDTLMDDFQVYPDSIVPFGEGDTVPAPWEESQPKDLSMEELEMLLNMLQQLTQPDGPTLPEWAPTPSIPNTMPLPNSEGMPWPGDGSLADGLIPESYIPNMETPVYPGSPSTPQLSTESWTECEEYPAFEDYESYPAPQAGPVGGIQSLLNELARMGASTEELNSVLQELLGQANNESVDKRYW